MRSTCGVERGLPDGAATQCFWRQELIVGRGGNGLASTVTCRRCGRTPDASFAFCPYCGTPLSGAAYRGFSVGTPTTVLPPAAASYPPWTTGTPVSYARRREVDRTRTGVLLLAAGSAIGWIPVISILGGLLVLIGAILVILGRQAFGAAHERNVLIAIVLYVIGLVGAFLLAGSFLSSIETAASLPATEAASAVVSAFDGFLIGSVIVGIFSGLATVLFLWALLDLPGKILIWASFVSSFVILGVVWAVITGQLGNAVASAFVGSPPDLGPLIALDNQLNSLRLLDILPDLLAAGAAYVAWARIVQGRIPERRGSPLPPG